MPKVLVEEAEPLLVNEENSIQDQDTTNPENLQHEEAREQTLEKRFRHFRYKDAAASRQLFQHLRELSRRWLDRKKA
ncbi:zinc finger protein 202-like [Petaurus breviceps papuanus]|uniref:zinc finger protein 202-like n=1 Tax=Petaurus breviceps papuanus TaxID=3040969 RepID=UPI0036DD17A5